MAFTCPFCGAVSHNPNDARERYCGRCLFVDDQIHPDHVVKVCRPGSGPGCCAYLASVEPPIYFCAKVMPDLVRAIRERMADGTMGARGDNCSGPPDYKPKS